MTASTNGLHKNITGDCTRPKEITACLHPWRRRPVIAHIPGLPYDLPCCAELPVSEPGLLEAPPWKDGLRLGYCTCVQHHILNSKAVLRNCSILARANFTFGAPS